MPLLPCYISTERPAFTAAECATIRQLGDGQQTRAGDVLSREAVGETVYELSPNRDSSVVFLEQTPDSEWIYRRLAQVVQESNRNFWQFELARGECIQYSRYSAAQHYHWHMDLGSEGDIMQRKLSLTLQLSEPDSYQGGDLEFMIGRAREVAAREQGVVTIFPSYVLHRVTPVEQGIRCSLVQWICGRRPFS